MLTPDPAALPAEVQALYPFAVQSWDSPQGLMRYVDHGPQDGQVVLLLHGNPSWSFLWRNLIIALAARGLRVIAPDHLGMGLSARPAQLLRLADRIAAIQGLVEHLGVNHFHLGVHDWGGAIGFGVATRWPDRIGRILVTNTGAFLSDRIPTRIALCRVPVLGRLIAQHFNGFAWPATWMAVENPLPRAVKAGFLAPYGTIAQRQAVADFVADIPLEPAHPTRPTLAAIEAALPRLQAKPMLLFWGLKDFCFDAAFLAGFTQRFPQAQKQVYPDAGHYVLEDTGAAGVEVAADFLATV